MRSFITFIILATMAAFALAAPVASPKASPERKFKIKSGGHRKLSPAEAMLQAYNKHGWEIIIFPWLYGGSSSAATFPSATAAPGYGYSSSAFGGGSTSGPAPSATGSAPGYGPPASSSFAAGSSGGAASAPPASSSGGSSSGGAPSPSATQSAGPQPSTSGTPTDGSEEGEVTATPEQNESQYLAPVVIGGQTLNLNLDTGSADLWVYSNRLSSSLTQGHSVYNPDRSSTFTDYQGGSWDILYGDGSEASGSVGFDTVSVGGAVVEKQCVELAETISQSFTTQVNSDGIMGLGFSNGNQVSPQQQKTFFDNIMDELDQPLFTADLEEDASGTYEFGSIDASKYNGEIHYTPVDSSNGYWQFEAPTFTLGGNQQECQTCSPIIADTGTSLVLLDSDIVETYYNQIQGAQFDSGNGGIVFPCNADIPDFGIEIGNGYTATLSGQDLIYAQVSGGNCFGGIQASGAGIQIIGDVLLKQYFAIFDGGNMRFGIASKA